jgi:hypothetical protein
VIKIVSREIDSFLAPVPMIILGNRAKVKLVKTKWGALILKAAIGSRIEGCQGISQGVANKNKLRVIHPISDTKLISE